MAKKRLLIINWQDRTNPFFGGAEVHLHEIFGRLARDYDYDVTLLCASYPGARREEELDGMHIVRSEGNRNTFDRRVKREYKRLVRDHGVFDLVIEDMNKMPFMAAKWADCAVMVQVHHFFGKTIWKEFPWFLFPFPLYVMWGERRALRLYRRKKLPIISVSESTAGDLMAAGIDRERIRIIYNGIRNDVFFPDPSLPEADLPTIVYLGRIKTYKRVDVLIRAMPAIRERILNARLIIIGSGDGLPALRDLVDRLSLSEEVVRFAGFVSEEKKVEYLRRAWVAVNTSPKEGWGIVGMEAQACGTPVVVSDAPGLRESVIDGKTGFLFDFGDEQQLAERITILLKSRELREKMGVAAVEWASGFTWDRAAKETDIAIREEMDKNG
ncbi:glycosyltransferase family 4 protein [bacterium]|nr:glycosyltransferase family 4 protein [bacterium]